MAQSRTRRRFTGAIGIALALALVPASSQAKGLPSDLARALDAYNQATVHNDTATRASCLRLSKSSMRAKSATALLFTFLG